MLLNVGLIGFNHLFYCVVFGAALSLSIQGRGRTVMVLEEGEERGLAPWTFISASNLQCTALSSQCI